MIKPSLGRIVWYTPTATDPIAADQDGRCAAIVVNVHSDRQVSLGVLDAKGVWRLRVDVPLLQDDDKPPASGSYAIWMPYQKGQAAKTEEAEKQLAAKT